MKNKKLIRQEFNDSVFKRDKYKCVFCNVTENLDAHHITDRHEMPNDGYVKENGITLCSKHHLDAERFHMTKGKEWVENMHPDDLYEIIGSSYEIAFTESERLT